VINKDVYKCQRQCLWPHAFYHRLINRNSCWTRYTQLLHTVFFGRSSYQPQALLYLNAGNALNRPFLSRDSAASLCRLSRLCIYQNESIKQSIDQSLFAQLATETAMQNKADARGQDSETYSTDHCPKSKNK